MSDNRKSPGFYVTCPGCGKVHQKSIMTESIIVCPRCGYEFYSLLKNGVCISFPASQIDNTSFFGQVKNLASTLDSLIPTEAGTIRREARI